MASGVFKLDVLDRRIIAALEQDSRQSNKAIARKVSANEHVVAYRIQRFFQQGVVKKIYCMIARGVLFPVGYRVFLRFQSLSPEKEAILAKRAAECKYTNWVVTCRGHWDMIITMFVNDPAHFMEVFFGITSGFEDFIQEKEIVSYLEMIDFNRTHLYKGEPYEMLEYDGKFRKKDVDSLDVLILEQLSTNSRLPLIEMAAKFKVSPDTIRNRIKRLEDEKIIIGHGVLFDLPKIGLGYANVLLNLKNLTREREKALKNFALQYPNVIFWIKAIGGYDLALELEIEDSKLDDFVTELRNKFGDIIKNLEVLSIRKEFKYAYLTQK